MAIVTERPASVPGRSLAQRMEALDRANAVRSRRAQLKRDIAAGREQVSRVLARQPACVETMRVRDLLLALPRWGQVKTNKVLHCCVISPTRTVSDLTARQRAALIRLLGDR